MGTAGPLGGIRIVEMTGLGPAPLAGQLLADLGAEVICIDRSVGKPDPTDINRRNKRSIALDLKQTEGADACKRLIARADIVIEGFRPGVMERLGLGPAEMCAANPRLIYARMTGWGQAGPFASMAGHDINYISLSGALNSIGPRDAPPVPPLNFVGDYGGGTMFLIFGILAALVERQHSQRGQVVDVAMVDGVAAMMSAFYMLHARQNWSEQREANLLDGGAPFYRCYETSDGKAMAVGPIESQFFAEFCAKLGLTDEPLQAQNDREKWSEQAERFAEAFKRKCRDEWAEIFRDSDACVTPVLTISESEHHRHVRERAIVFRGEANVLQAAPAPRFERTPAPPVRPPFGAGENGGEILVELGYKSEDIARMRRQGALK